MPIYEYQCTACMHALEKLQKLSDPPLEICPACEQHSLKKKVSAAGFRLTGGGWYETDFKKSGSKKNLAGEAGTSSSASEATTTNPSSAVSSESKSSSTKSESASN